MNFTSIYVRFHYRAGNIRVDKPLCFISVLFLSDYVFVDKKCMVKMDSNKKRKFVLSFQKSYITFCFRKVESYSLFAASVLLVYIRKAAFLDTMLFRNILN